MSKSKDEASLKKIRDLNTKLAKINDKARKADKALEAKATAYNKINSKIEEADAKVTSLTKDLKTIDATGLRVADVKGKKSQIKEKLQLLKDQIKLDRQTRGDAKAQYDSAYKLQEELNKKNETERASILELRNKIIEKNRQISGIAEPTPNVFSLTQHSIDGKKSINTSEMEDKLGAATKDYKKQKASAKIAEKDYEKKLAKLEKKTVGLTKAQKREAPLRGKVADTKNVINANNRNFSNAITAEALQQKKLAQQEQKLTEIRTQLLSDNPGDIKALLKQEKALEKEINKSQGLIAKTNKQIVFYQNKDERLNTKLEKREAILATEQQRKGFFSKGSGHHEAKVAQARADLMTNAIAKRDKENTKTPISKANVVTTRGVTGAPVVQFSQTSSQPHYNVHAQKAQQQIQSMQDRQIMQALQGIPGIDVNAIMHAVRNPTPGIQQFGNTKVVTFNDPYKAQEYIRSLGPSNIVYQSANTGINSNSTHYNQSSSNNMPTFNGRADAESYARGLGVDVNGSNSYRPNQQYSSFAPPPMFANNSSVQYAQESSPPRYSQYEPSQSSVADASRYSGPQTTAQTLIADPNAKKMTSPMIAQWDERKNAVAKAHADAKSNFTEADNKFTELTDKFVSSVNIKKHEQSRPLQPTKSDTAAYKKWEEDNAKWEETSNVLVNKFLTESRSTPEYKEIEQLGSIQHKAFLSEKKNVSTDREVKSAINSFVKDNKGKSISSLDDYNAMKKAHYKIAPELEYAKGKESFVSLVGGTEVIHEAYGQSWNNEHKSQIDPIALKIQEYEVQHNITPQHKEAILKQAQQELNEEAAKAAEKAKEAKAAAPAKPAPEAETEIKGPETDAKSADAKTQDAPALPSQDALQQAADELGKKVIGSGSGDKQNNPDTPNPLESELKTALDAKSDTPSTTQPEAPKIVVTAPEPIHDTAQGAQAHVAQTEHTPPEPKAPDATVVAKPGITQAPESHTQTPKTTATVTPESQTQTPVAQQPEPKAAEATVVTPVPTIKVKEPEPIHNTGSPAHPKPGAPFEPDLYTPTIPTTFNNDPRSNITGVSEVRFTGVQTTAVAKNNTKEFVAQQAAEAAKGGRVD